jgi:hypothetical protein
MKGRLTSLMAYLCCSYIATRLMHQPTTHSM